MSSTATPRTFTIVAQNFREIGPVRTRDGRRLKPGILFRSGDLSGATDACVAQMQTLGIRSVVDLRSVSERRMHPYDWLPAIDTDAWGEPGELSAASITHLMRRANASVEEVVEGVRALYRDLPFSHAGSYAVLFRRVAEGRTPVLFGCAAGKDRTGVAAALLLWSIGVDFAEIEEDYLLTNRAADRLRTLAVSKYGWDSASPKFDIVLSADTRFLDAMVEAVTERCGGIDGYVADILGITPAERREIERQLLD